MALIMKEQIQDFIKEEDGVGVIEIVLILVVLIGLVIIFKTNIKKLLDGIFEEINKQSKEVY
ncbi:Flp pilus assembly pilin Flp [Lacrimispora xylanisolvens]|jgi:Flp pilus assembly pilin Flp|uniref:Flp pilus assembly pilin Flp n=2 Tax=Lachnospiraceae TaxID=186803 RepID=A0A2S6HDE2_9FIRM|nr:Flp1 family type IVb pilin [Hungatella xylanolytica]PPK75509.1 Flp pilus assembly pilin Flp [Hungatella xylanolytica]